MAKGAAGVRTAGKETQPRTIVGHHFSLGSGLCEKSPAGAELLWSCNGVGREGRGHRLTPATSPVAPQQTHAGSAIMGDPDPPRP
jgi:hypothetical protein